MHYRITPETGRYFPRYLDPHIFLWRKCDSEGKTYYISLQMPVCKGWSWKPSPWHWPSMHLHNNDSWDRPRSSLLHTQWVTYFSQSVQSPDFINNPILQAEEMQHRQLNYPQWGWTLSRQGEFSSHACLCEETPCIYKRSYMYPTHTCLKASRNKQFPTISLRLLYSD